MTLRLLPPLLGFPWEVRGASVLPATLSPFVVTGSPLTKTLGASVTVNWAVRNDGNTTGYALLRVNAYAPEISGYYEVARVGPVEVLAGRQATLSASWTPSQAETQSVTLILEETSQAGQVLRQIAQDAAALDVVEPDPTADLNHVRIGDSWSSGPLSDGRFESFTLTSFKRYYTNFFSFFCTYKSYDNTLYSNIELNPSGIRTIEEAYSKVTGTGETFLQFKQRVGF